MKTEASKLFNKATAWWFMLLLSSQFHFNFYASRPLPNTFGLISGIKTYWTCPLSHQCCWLIINIVNTEPQTPCQCCGHLYSGWGGSGQQWFLRLHSPPWCSVATLFSCVAPWPSRYCSRDRWAHALVDHFGVHPCDLAGESCNGHRACCETRMCLSTCTSAVIYAISALGRAKWCREPRCVFRMSCCQTYNLFPHIVNTTPPHAGTQRSRCVWTHFFGSGCSGPKARGSGSTCTWTKATR